MHPFLFNLGPYPISSYWALGMLGLLAACAYVFFTIHGRRVAYLPGEDMLHIACLAVVGALIGAKLLAIVTVIPLIVENWELLAAQGIVGLLVGLFTTGFVFYGGAIGGFLAALWYCKKYNVSFKITMALTAPAIPLFHTFGRLGCFFGGCCWGIESPWGVIFPPESLGAPSGVLLLPIQLIEAGLNFALFVFLAVLSRRIEKKWMTMPSYIFCYGVLRFILEFFRGDSARGVFLLSTSQWISLALVVGTALLYILRWRGAPDLPDTKPFVPYPPQPVAAGAYSESVQNEIRR